MNKIAAFFLILIASYACQQAKETTGTESSLINQLAKHRIDSTLQSFIADSIVVGVSALIFED